jgi:hypothetical protein
LALSATDDDFFGLIDFGVMQKLLFMGGYGSGSARIWIRIRKDPEPELGTALLRLYSELSLLVPIDKAFSLIYCNPNMFFTSQSKKDSNIHNMCKLFSPIYFQSYVDPLLLFGLCSQKVGKALHKDSDCQELEVMDSDPV